MLLRGDIKLMERLTNEMCGNLKKCQDCIEDSNCYEFSCGEIESAIRRLQEFENASITIKEVTDIIESWRLKIRFRNDNETGDYVKGYKDGYDKAIENVIKAIVTT
jgi:hypothetical protein